MPRRARSIAMAAPIRLPPVMSATRSRSSMGRRDYIGVGLLNFLRFLGATSRQDKSDSRQRLTMAEEARPGGVGGHPAFRGFDVEEDRIETRADFIPIERHRDWCARPPSHREWRGNGLTWRVPHDVEVNGGEAPGPTCLERHELRM